MTTPDPRVPSGGQAGFSIVEMLVAAGVMALAILGILALFDLNRDLARTQVQVADLQQSVRVAQNEMIRDVRMAGRGGLPRGVLPQGIAVSVRNDVPATGGGHHVAVGDTDSPEVVAGSDVLTVRGVFSTSIYQVNPTSGQLTLDAYAKARKYGIQPASTRAHDVQAAIPAQVLLEGERPVPEATEALIGACYLAFGFERTAPALAPVPPPPVAVLARSRMATRR